MLLYFLVPLLAAAGPIGRSTGSNRPLTLSRRDFHFEDDRSYLQSRSAITSQRLQPRVDIFGPPGEPEGAEFLDIIPAQVEARRLDPTKEWNKAEGRERDSDKVRAAWAAARILAEAAVSTLVEFDQDVNEERGRLEDKAPKNGRGTIIRPNNVKLKLRSFIALTEPAYTQFFGADIDNVLTTSLNYEKIIDTAYNKDAKGRNGQPIYLTNFNEVWATDSDEDICISSDPNSKGTQAFALQVKHFRYFQQLKLDNWSDPPPFIPPDDAWVINFCPLFFEVPALGELLYDLAKNPNKKNDICNLANLDNTGLIVLHELTHPDFSLHTNNEPDKPNGELHADWALWDAAASRSVSGGKAQKSKFKEFSSKNAASYAWYSMYNYMNLVDGCQGVHWDNGIVSYTASQCATDIWPQDREKYVKNSWTEWA